MTQSAAGSSKSWQKPTRNSGRPKVVRSSLISRPPRALAGSYSFTNPSLLAHNSAFRGCVEFSRGLGLVWPVCYAELPHAEETESVGCRRAEVIPGQRLGDRRREEVAPVHRA